MRQNKEGNFATAVQTGTRKKAEIKLQCIRTKRHENTTERHQRETSAKAADQVAAGASADGNQRRSASPKTSDQGATRARADRASVAAAHGHCEDAVNALDNFAGRPLDVLATAAAGDHGPDELSSFHVPAAKGLEREGHELTAARPSLIAMLAVLVLSGLSSHSQRRSRGAVTVRGSQGVGDENFFKIPRVDAERHRERVLGGARR